MPTISGAVAAHTLNANNYRIQMLKPADQPTPYGLITGMWVGEVVNMTIGLISSEPVVMVGVALLLV